MARKKDRAAWEVDFCDLPLGKSEVEQCKKWDLDYALTVKECDNAVTKACKISISYNATTDSYIASLTVPSPEDGGQKKCFSSHAPDFMDALKIMAYKLATKLDSDPFNLHRKANMQDEWR